MNDDVKPLTMDDIPADWKKDARFVVSRIRATVEECDHWKARTKQECEVANQRTAQRDEAQQQVAVLREALVEVCLTVYGVRCWCLNPPPFEERGPGEHTDYCLQASTALDSTPDSRWRSPGVVAKVDALLLSFLDHHDGREAVEKALTLLRGGK